MVRRSDRSVHRLLGAAVQYCQTRRGGKGRNCAWNARTEKFGEPGFQHRCVLNGCLTQPMYRKTRIVMLLYRVQGKYIERTGRNQALMAEKG